MIGRREPCPPQSLKENQIVRSVFNTYTKQLPRFGDSPVIVEVEIHVQGISSLNEIRSDFEIDILFSQLWYDPGLSFANYSSCKKNITMESKYIDKIWTPNTCIINSKQSMIHKSPTENIMFILYEVAVI